MKHSFNISPSGKTSFTILHDYFLRIVNNTSKAINYCAAKLLEIIKNWTLYTRKACNTDWFFHSIHNFTENLKYEYGRSIVGRALTYLESEGFISRYRDETESTVYYYRFNFEEVQKAVDNKYNALQKNAPRFVVPLLPFGVASTPTPQVKSTAGSTDKHLPYLRANRGHVQIDRIINKQINKTKTSNPEKKRESARAREEENSTHVQRPAAESLVEAQPPPPIVKPKPQIKTKKLKKAKRPASSEKPKKRTIKFVWEDKVGRPYRLFLAWWACKHYKPQGGKWESAAYRNAYSEFYSNPERTEVTLFSQFLEEQQRITENVRERQAQGAVAVVPSYFAPQVEPNEENLQQVKGDLQQALEGGVEVADSGGAVNSSQTKPLVPQDKPPEIEPEPKSEEQKAEDKFLNEFARNQAKWRMPHLKAAAEAWALQHADRVEVTEDGLMLRDDGVP